MVAYILLHPFLTIYYVDTLLGLGQVNTIEVVYSGIIVFCILAQTKFP